MSPCCLLLLHWALLAQTPTTAEELIRQLGSNSFEQRQSANSGLKQIGPKALPALRAALAHPDPEIRYRSASLYDFLEEQVLIASLVTQLRKPTLIRFKFEKVRLAVALREIEAQTGLAIAMPEELAVRDRIITIDTDQLPFWQAWSEFRRQADLEEEPLDPGVDGQVIYLVSTSLASTRPVVHEQIEGSYRIRLSQGKAGRLLEFRADPGMKFEAMRDVRLRRCRDDRGTVVELTSSPSWEELRIRALPAIFSRIPFQELPAGIKLRELEGTFLVQLQVPHPLVEFEDVFNTQQKKRISTSGVMVELLNLQKSEEGEVSVMLQIDRLDLIPLPGPEQRVVRRPGLVTLRGPIDVAIDMLQWWDGKGRKHEPLNTAHHELERPTSFKIDLGYSLVPGSLAGSRLVLMGTRVVNVPIEFRLRVGRK